VIGHLLKMRRSRRAAPTDKLISVGTLPGCRSDQMHGQIAAKLIFDQVEQVTSHRPVAA
jgi:hypothetical protein